MDVRLVPARPRQDRLVEDGRRRRLLIDEAVDARAVEFRAREVRILELGLGVRRRRTDRSVVEGGVFEGRLVFRSREEEARAGQMIDDDLTRRWEAHDLCRSEDALFAASGVCDGYLPAAEIGKDYTVTHSEIIDVKNKSVQRFSTRRPL